LGNHFCRTHAKTASAKKLLSSNEVVEKEEEVEVEDRKKTFNKLPSKKREQEEDVPKSSNYLSCRKKKSLKRFWPTSDSQHPSMVLFFYSHQG